MLFCCLLIILDGPADNRLPPSDECLDPDRLRYVMSSLTWVQLFAKVTLADLAGKELMHSLSGDSSDKSTHPPS